MVDRAPANRLEASWPRNPGEPHEPELDPPFDVLEPAALTSPLVFSSPHSGDVYPRRFLDCARLAHETLRRTEDAFVDALFSGALALGAPLIRARFPRAYLDLNREPYELDPRMFDGRLPFAANTRSLRVAGGLGTIPRVASQAQEIYAARLPVAEAIGRIEKLYKPYHARLGELLARAQRHFGVALLVDCHSMPSGASHAGAATASGAPSAPGFATADGRRRVDFVVGDRHGTSCASALVEAVEAELTGLGFCVQRNKPYAGGFITEHYGAPFSHCHALQIEVSRALYMDEQTVTKAARFDEISAALTEVAAKLKAITLALPTLHRAAAE
ncbi:N-formylglutamate amidohydrolase [Methylocapsa acidiphila]|uniref:N-formylglutamate amidohydrolase n=1 Tax=Methylocapsa acidiphila TaxID=133552 RepID=UPI0004078089|nr:N-formylglutamate amidohydrolase [Methylocapsa acidiphila]